jgi:hypothetical protein
MHVVADWIIFGCGIFSSAPPLDIYLSYHQHISITCRTRLHVIDLLSGIGEKCTSGGAQMEIPLWISEVQTHVFIFTILMYF